MQIVQAAQLLGIRPFKCGEFTYLVRDSSIFLHSGGNGWSSRGILSLPTYTEITWEEWEKRIQGSGSHYTALRNAVSSCLDK